MRKNLLCEYKNEGNRRRLFYYLNKSNDIAEIRGIREGSKGKPSDILEDTCKITLHMHNWFHGSRCVHPDKPFATLMRVRF